MKSFASVWMPASGSGTEQRLAENRVIGFSRRKTGSMARLRLGDEVVEILHSLPSRDPLFDNLRTVRASDRATEFKQRCRLLGIEGVTLHSYR